MKESVHELTLESGEAVTLTVQEYGPSDAGIVTIEAHALDAEPRYTITVKEVRCPRCGVGELEPGTEHLPFYDHTNPTAPHKLFAIRGFKVHHSDEWWSECLHCAKVYTSGWFSESGITESQERV